MLSLKRLAYVLFIVFGICGIFIVYNINESSSKTVAKEKPDTEEIEWIEGQSFSKSEEYHFYVVGSEEKEIYKDIYRNVCQLMEDMKVVWNKKDTIGEEELENRNAVIVFCDDVVNPYVELPQLVQFIENGGKVILAAGVAEGYEDSYLMPVLGILEKTIKENYQNFHFMKPFFALQEEYMTYDGYNMSTWMNVRKDADVYVEDQQKKVPVLYAYPYGKGKTFVVNATILSDNRCMGFLTAGIGSLLEEFVYPVLGTESIYLDDFPVDSYVNDSVCMKLYGRTSEAFVRDVVWPVFQGMAVRNEVRYTASVMHAKAKDGSDLGINESFLKTIEKSVMMYNGEMTYASDCKVVRGKFQAQNQEERMAVLEDVCVFPEATDGIDLEGGNMLAIASVLTSHGMVSHSFNINRIVCMDEEYASWKVDKKQLRAFEKKILKETDYLQKTTLTETRNPLKSYRNLEYTWRRNDDSLEIYATKFVEGQPFLFRTEGEITDAKGTEYVKLDNHYYFLRLLLPKVVLKMEEGESE